MDEVDSLLQALLQGGTNLSKVSVCMAPWESVLVVSERLIEVGLGELSCHPA